MRCMRSVEVGTEVVVVWWMWVGRGVGIVGGVETGNNGGRGLFLGFFFLELYFLFNDGEDD